MLYEQYYNALVNYENKISFVMTDELVSGIDKYQWGPVSSDLVIVAVTK